MTCHTFLSQLFSSVDFFCSTLFVSHISPRFTFGEWKNTLLHLQFAQTTFYPFSLSQMVSIFQKWRLQICLLVKHVRTEHVEKQGFDLIHLTLRKLFPFYCIHSWFRFLNLSNPGNVEKPWLKIWYQLLHPIEMELHRNGT